MGLLKGDLGVRVASLKRRLPKMLERETEKFYKDNFRLGGKQVAKGRVEKWADRKKDYPHPTLRKTGALMNSIKAQYTYKIIKVEAGRGLPRDYAKFHNDKTGSWKPNVQREFLYDSHALKEHLEDFIMDELKKIL